MRIAIHPAGQKVALLDANQLRLFSAGLDLVASIDLPSAKLLAASGAGVAVLTGKLSVAGASFSGATVHLFSWTLAPLGKIEVGEVDRHGLSLSADGSRLAVTDWRTGQVTVLDTRSGARVGGAGESIPSGASLSPDGSLAVAGTADQGDGAILLFEVSKAANGKLPMRELPPPESKVGLDDAPYFSAFSPDGALAALSNESWGGRGLFVYDIEAREPLWSAELPSSDDEPEAWSPPLFTFAAQGSLLLVRLPDTILAFRADDGTRLGEIDAEGDGSDGLAADDLARRILLPGPTPTALPYPAAWTGDPHSAPQVAPTRSAPPRKAAPAKAASKPTAKKPAASKPTAKKPATKNAAKKPAKKAASKPTAKKPTAKKPTAKKPTAKKPAAKKPAAKKPATEDAAKKPAARKAASKTAGKPAARARKGTGAKAAKKQVARGRSR